MLLVGRQNPLRTSDLYPRGADCDADVSDFRKAWLKRQVLNFGALDPDVAVCRSVQLYKYLRSFIFRQTSPPTDTLRKRAGAIDMVLSDERGLDVPCDIRHLRLLAWPTLHLSNLFRKCERWALKTKFGVPLFFWLHAVPTWVG